MKYLEKTMSTKKYAKLDTKSFYANCQAKHLNIK